MAIAFGWTKCKKLKLPNENTIAPNRAAENCRRRRNKNNVMPASIAGYSASIPNRRRASAASSDRAVNAGDDTFHTALHRLGKNHNTDRGTNRTADGWRVAGHRTLATANETRRGRRRHTLAPPVLVRQAAPTAP